MPDAPALALAVASYTGDTGRWWGGAGNHRPGGYPAHLPEPPALNDAAHSLRITQPKLHETPHAAVSLTFIFPFVRATGNVS